MSKKANPTVIGVFVVVALAIAAAAIVMLGSGKLFKKTITYVMYFESSLSGLDVGAPVEYQGVRIGSVKDIKLVYDTDTGIATLPVYIEVNADSFVLTGSLMHRKDIAVHIENGLRGQLRTQSMVTGKLKVALVMMPEIPVRLVGGDTTVPEVPTTLNLAEALKNTLDNLPLADIVSNVNTTLQEIATMMGSQETKEALEALRKTMANAEEISASMRFLLEENAPLRVELEATMEQLTEAVKALRILSEQLERHPESVIWGK